MLPPRVRVDIGKKSNKRLIKTSNFLTRSLAAGSSLSSYPGFLPMTTQGIIHLEENKLLSAFQFFGVPFSSVVGLLIFWCPLYFLHSLLFPGSLLFPLIFWCSFQFLVSSFWLTPFYLYFWQPLLCWFFFDAPFSFIVISVCLSSPFPPSFGVPLSFDVPFSFADHFSFGVPLPFGSPSYFGAPIFCCPFLFCVPFSFAVPFSYICVS